MKKRSLALGLTGLLFLPISSLACNMQNVAIPESKAETQDAGETLDNRVEREVYNFADELSRKMPEDFVCQEFNNQLFYHDKKLKIEGGLPVEGSGRYVITDNNGVVSLGEWVDTGKKPDVANIKLAFAYFRLGDTFSSIVLIKKPRVIQYARGILSCKRQVYDFDEIKDMKIDEIDDIKPKAETTAKREEILKYFELIRRIRKTYPAKDETLKTKLELCKQG